MHEVLEDAEALQQDFELLQIQFPVPVLVDVLDDVEHVLDAQVQDIDEDGNGELDLEEFEVLLERFGIFEDLMHVP